MINSNSLTLPFLVYQMKRIFLLIFVMSLSWVNAQTNEDLTRTWHMCGSKNSDMDSDTLFFTIEMPNCRDNDCGQHDWSFRSSGSVEFLFTNSCDTGFGSKAKTPKKWYLKDGNRLIFTAVEGYQDFFDVLHVDEEQLILLHRFDLED